MSQKAPAIQFYVKDWLSDEAVGASTLQTQGLWMRILCLLYLSHTRGELTRTPDEWCRMTGCSRRQFDEFLTEARALLFCYEYEKVTGNVTLRSRRMWRDDKDRRDNALRQATYREKHKSNGDSNGIVTPSSASAIALELSKDSSCSTSGDVRTPVSDDAIRLARRLLNRIILWKSNYSRPSPAAFAKWQIDLDRMLRLDKRTVQEVEAVIDWATTDDFWQPNILSAAKLRKQFDTLQAQMARKDKPQSAEARTAEYHNREWDRLQRASAKRKAEWVEKQAIQDAKTPEEKEADAAKLLAFKNQMRATLKMPPLEKGGV